MIFPDGSAILLVNYGAGTLKRIGLTAARIRRCVRVSAGERYGSAEKLKRALERV